MSVASEPVELKESQKGGDLSHMTKSIAYGLLAMAVSTSIALAGGDDEKKNNAYQGNSGVSWKPGSGITFDGGDEFKLTWLNQLQVQYVYESNEDADNVSNFDVRRARTEFKGHVFNKNIGYYLQMDGADSRPALKQGWARYDFVSDDQKKVGVKVGQAKTGFGLEGSGTSKGLFFVERSGASSIFSNTYTRGAWLYGSYMENKLRWIAGAMNGDVANGIDVLDKGEEADNADNELSYTLNVSFDPLGDYTGGTDNFSIRQGDLGDGTKDLLGTIGAGVFFGNNKAVGAPNGPDVESTEFNLNTAWRVSNFFAQGEVFIRSDEPTGGTTEDSMGWYVMAGYALPKKGDSDMQWALGLRVSMAETDDTAAFLGGTAGDATEISAVLNAFYHGHACKTQVEYTMQDLNPDLGSDQSNHIIRVQFQVLF